MILCIFLLLKIAVFSKNVTEEGSVIVGDCCAAFWVGVKSLHYRFGRWGSPKTSDGLSTE